MRYNIKRLFREHEEYKRQFEVLRKMPDPTHQPYISEKNRLSHAMSLCRQYIGHEVVERLREGKELDIDILEDWEGTSSPYLPQL